MSKKPEFKFHFTSPLGSYLTYELRFPFLENEINNNTKLAEFKKLIEHLPYALFLASQIERMLSKGKGHAMLCNFEQAFVSFWASKKHTKMSFGLFLPL